MMSLFDEEQIMKSFIRSERHDADRETAERMIKDGELSLEKIARYVPALSMEELKEIEAECTSTKYLVLSIFCCKQGVNRPVVLV